jgi:mono/diheme cytochrome c family protein
MEDIVFKQIWMLLALALVSVLALGACGGGDLAEDLTPIPTLPPGEEPTLLSPVAGSAPATTEGAALSEDELIALGGETFTANCAFCHGEQAGAAPAFPGMAARAAERVDGMSAEEYIHQSIVDPSAYVVEGYNAMPPVAGQLSDTEINALVAYIMNKSVEGGMASTAETPEPTTEPTSEPGPTEEPTPTSAPEETTPAATVDLELGKTLFEANCAMCHGESDGPGPAFTGMGERAAERVDGMSAEDYIHESIVDPSAYVVEGFDDIMPKDYSDRLSEDDIANLIAYILSQ